jgi:2-oxoisovalerate dehydrogenase E1 component alpha subunit
MSSHLQFQRPPARPGEAPDFRFLRLDNPDAVARLPVDIGVADTAILASRLIRVLDEKGIAVGEWDPRLQPAQLREGLRLMLLTRIFDERMQLMQRQGKITFYMKSTGEEAVSVAQAMAVRPDDMMFPTYRNQGLHFARGRSPVDLMCQCLSNTGDMCKGRQMPVFYHWGSGNIFSVSGNLGTQFPQATGWAMAEGIKGGSRLALGWIGEGATAEADFHHAVLFAGVYRAPVVLNVVNNQWAISTFQSVAGGNEGSFASRGIPYGVAGLRVDGNDFLATYAATQWAAERARKRLGPTLIELVTYRASAHSTSDDPSRYRPKDDYLAWPLGDPIERLRQHLNALGEWSDEQHQTLRQELEKHVIACWKNAVSLGTLNDAPRLAPASMFEDVFQHISPNLQRQQKQLEDLLRQQNQNATDK